MGEATLYTLLKTLNIPVAYDHFVVTNEITVSPPFVLYRNDDSNNFKAEDKVYLKNNKYIIDLVTETKDTAKETTLETLLDNNNIPWDKAEDYIESEKIYQIRYFI